jgi:hypothetical protein
MKPIRRFAALAVFLVSLVAVSEVRSGEVAPLPDTIGPYLQNPAPDSMTVCYLTKGEEGRVGVLHGAAEAKKELAATPTKIPGTPWTVWKARLSGL